MIRYSNKTYIDDPYKNVSNWVRPGNYAITTFVNTKQVWQIGRVTEEGFVYLINPTSNEYGGRLVKPEELYPVMFRPYTKDEAAKLVGQVFHFPSGETALLLAYDPHSIAPYQFKNWAGNWDELDCAGVLQSNGLPVGVPIVDDSDIR